MLLIQNKITLANTYFLYCSKTFIMLISVSDIIIALQDPFLFWGLLLGSNVIMFLGTVLISYCWSSFYRHEKLPLTKKDIRLSVFIMIINTIVAVPGYILFTYSKIVFSDINFIRDFLLLFFIVDFMMYVFHYISHYVRPFSLIHKEHHEHYNFNEISLYVMHPAEALLFGFILTIIPLFITLNLYSFIFFLFFNWIAGVISHLNTSSDQRISLFGNNIFHKNHHQYPKYNFGFYTTIWDKIFRTYYTKTMNKN